MRRLTFTLVAALLMVLSTTDGRQATRSEVIARESRGVLAEYRELEAQRVGSELYKERMKGVEAERKGRVEFSKFVEAVTKEANAPPAVRCPGGYGVRNAEHGRRHAMLYVFGADDYRTCLESVNTPGFIATLVESTARAGALKRAQAAHLAFLREQDEIANRNDGEQDAVAGEEVNENDQDGDQPSEADAADLLVALDDAMEDEDEDEDEDRDGDDADAEVTAVALDRGARSANDEEREAVRKAKMEARAAERYAEEKEKKSAYGTVHPSDKGLIPTILFNSENIHCAEKSVKHIRGLFPGDRVYEKCINDIKGMQPVDVSAGEDKGAAADVLLVVEHGDSDSDGDSDMLLARSKGFGPPFWMRVGAKGWRPNPTPTVIVNGGWQPDTRNAITASLNINTNNLNNLNNQNQNQNPNTFAAGVRINAAVATPPPACAKANGPKADDRGFVEGRAEGILLTACVHQAHMRHADWEKTMERESRKIRIEADNPLLHNLGHTSRKAQDDVLKAMTRLKAQEYIQAMIVRFQKTYLAGKKSKSTLMQEVWRSRKDPKEAGGQEPSYALPPGTIGIKRKRVSRERPRHTGAHDDIPADSTLDTAVAVDERLGRV
jgi:hypothetical protein